MTAQCGEKGLIRQFVCLTEHPETYQRVEFSMEVPSLPVGYNVFYEKDVAVAIVLQSPSGKTLTMPGFYYQPFVYDDEGNQVGPADEAPSFRLRVTLPEAGEWTYEATLSVRGKEPDRVTGLLTVALGADQRGFLRVEPNRRQNFMFDDGTVYVPAGENMAWAWPVSPKSGHSAYFRRQMEKLAAQKANFLRIWSATFALYLLDKHMDPSYFGMSDIDQFDRIVETAEELDFYLDFTMYHHGQFSARPGLPEHDYHNCAYSQENEGYLNTPEDFFTNKRAKRDARSLMRYMVARWGYSRHIMCWEFFNEQDICDAGWNHDLMREWHEEMTEYLRSIDPYQHLVTTSSACYSDRTVRHEMFDFISLHVYNYHDLSLLSDLQKNDWHTFHRPILFAEMGINGGFGKGYAGRSCGEDKLELHQQNWIGVMGGGAGTSMSWFWEQVDATDAYDTFRAVSEMAARIPWRDPTLKMVDHFDVTVSAAPLLVQGYAKADSAYLWIYDRGYRHDNRQDITEFTGETVSLALADGGYTLTFIDPWSGDTVETAFASAENGRLTATLPAFRRDLALVITR